MGIYWHGKMILLYVGKVSAHSEGHSGGGQILTLPKEGEIGLLSDGK
jgi:hypothetical protein